MKSKQTLKIGQKYKVIKDEYNCIGASIPRIVTVIKLGIKGCFFDENDYFYDLNSINFELQLITKKKSNWKYSREEIIKMIKEKIFLGYNERKVIKWLKETNSKSTPKKKSKEIKQEDKKECLTGISKHKLQEAELNVKFSKPTPSLLNDIETIEEIEEYCNRGEVSTTINMLIKNKRILTGIIKSLLIK